MSFFSTLTDRTTDQVSCKPDGMGNLHKKDENSISNRSQENHVHILPQNKIDWQTATVKKLYRLHVNR